MKWTKLDTISAIVLVVLIIINNYTEENDLSIVQIFELLLIIDVWFKLRTNEQQ